MDQREEKILSEEVVSNVCQGVAEELVPSEHPIEKSALEEFGPMGENPLSLSQEFTSQLNEIESIESKLEFTLKFMQGALEKGGGQNFKEFWDARKLCIAFFKEPMNPTTRVQLWATYSEVCREARRLKELFDEQSAYLTEQLEMAIAGLKEEASQFPSRLSEMGAVPEIEQSTVLKNKEQYYLLQKELNGLNAFAQRTTALRKELIHADIKLRNKNKLFQQLSGLGDSVFPRRKECIQKISQLYSSDVDLFIKSLEAEKLSTPELFAIRDQIKAVQHIAKLLTLSTEVFNKTRLALSECWDGIKTVIKERKRIQSEVRHEKRQHREELLRELEELKAAFIEKKREVAEIERGLKHLHHTMRSLPLLPPDVAFLKEKFKELEQQLNLKRDEEKSERQARLKGKEEEKSRQVREKMDRLEACLRAPQEATLEQIHAIEKEISSLSLTKKEQYDCEHLIYKVKNALVSYQREQLLSSSTPERAALIKERDLLIEQKQEIKTHLDALRKERGASSTDFSQAIQLEEMIQEAKERLKGIEEALIRLEGAI